MFRRKIRRMPSFGSSVVQLRLNGGKPLAGHAIGHPHLAPDEARRLSLWKIAGVQSTAMMSPQCFFVVIDSPALGDHMQRALLVL